MNRKYSKIIIIVIIGLVILFSIAYDRIFTRTKGSIHIALVAPMSGHDAALGEDIHRGVMFYVDNLNQSGGVDGKKIVIDLYDDENDEEKAKEKAREIVGRNRAVAVIGHVNSSNSINAGKIYKEHGIPAITPASTNSRVTRDNEWYFRNVFNDDKQGLLLAEYIKRALKRDAVDVVFSRDAYGSYIADVVADASQNIGLKITNKWSFDPDDANLNENLNRIVAEIQTRGDAGALLLLTRGREGVKLVKRIKDAGIDTILIGPDSYAEREFAHGFDALAKEKKNPGCYTDGVLVSTPLIFDIADEEAQYFEEAYSLKYGVEPDWPAAYAHDAVGLIVEAVKERGVTGETMVMKREREEIKDFLANLNIDHALKGITGSVYFDENGDASKQIWMGVYKNRTIISAFTQFRTIDNPREILNLQKEVDAGHIMRAGAAYMHKTNVVYTGARMNEIRDPDIEKSTCTLDFHIWFRSHGVDGGDAGNIRFLNAVEPISLGAPIHEEVESRMVYRRYHVKGVFKIDFLPNHRHAFGLYHILGFSFRHRELTRENLIYAKDSLGMGLMAGRSGYKPSEEKHILNPKTGWIINHFYFFQNTEKTNSMGAPKYLNKRGKLEFSAFNAEIEIKKAKFSLRGALPEEIAKYATLAGALILLLVVMAKNNVFADFGKVYWTLQALSAFLLILSGEIYVISRLGSWGVDYHMIDNIIMIFDIVWWFISALLINSAVERFIWLRLEKRTGRSVARVVRHFGAFIIYTLAFFGVIGFVFDQKITGLLATSGVLAMIIGLAIQMNISNIFSGIAINVEQPFRVGDWINVGSIGDAKVVDVNWRTTRLLTILNEVISVPNHTVAESMIRNYHYPDDHFWVGFTVHIDPVHPIEKVEKILREAVLATDDLESPWIAFAGISDWAADYWVYGMGKDYGENTTLKLKLWRNVKNLLDSAGVAPIIRNQNIRILETGKDSEVQGQV